jgi:HTH-type transcriptional regulator/antitoxin HipB
MTYMDEIPLHTPAAVGALIRDRRHALGLDQAELAARIGVSRLWVNQIERGKPGAGLGLVLRAFAALGVVLSGRSSDTQEGGRPAAIVTQDINAIIAEARRNDRR